MASVQSQEIPEVKDFMRDFWKLVKAFWILEDKDEYWDSLINRVNALNEQYPFEFCHTQCLAFMDYLDKKCIRELEDKDETIRE